MMVFRFLRPLRYRSRLAPKFSYMYTSFHTMGRLPSALAMPLCAAQSICNAMRTLAILFIFFRFNTHLAAETEALHGHVARVAVVHTSSKSSQKRSTASSKSPRISSHV